MELDATAAGGEKVTRLKMEQSGVSVKLGKSEVDMGMRASTFEETRRNAERVWCSKLRQEHLASAPEADVLTLAKRMSARQKEHWERASDCDAPHGARGNTTLTGALGEAIGLMPSVAASRQLAAPLSESAVRWMAAAKRELHSLTLEIAKDTELYGILTSL